MTIQDHKPQSFRYVRWKAALFGALPLTLVMLMVWVGVEAIDPTWTAQVSKGKYLVDAPNWVRSPVILATAIAPLIPSGWLLWASLTRAIVVEVTDRGIAARMMFGRKRSVTWASIVDAKRKKNQLVLSPSARTRFCRRSGTAGRYSWISGCSMRQWARSRLQSIPIGPILDSGMYND